MQKAIQNAIISKYFVNVTTVSTVRSEIRVQICVPVNNFHMTDTTVHAPFLQQCDDPQPQKFQL